MHEMVPVVILNSGAGPVVGWWAGGDRPVGGDGRLEQLLVGAPGAPEGQPARYRACHTDPAHPVGRARGHPIEATLPVSV